MTWDEILIILIYKVIILIAIVLAVKLFKHVYRQIFSAKLLAK